MKKTLATALTAALILSCLCGCTEQKENDTYKDCDDTPVTTAEDTEEAEGSDSPSIDELSEDPDESEVQALDWEIPENIEITDELSDLFARAAEGLTGAGYTPELFMGSASGETSVYCFLCSTVQTGSDDRPYWTIVYITEDLEGNASFDKVCLIDYASSSSAEAPVIAGSPSSNLPGGWAPTTDLTVDEDLLNVFIDSVIDIGMGGVLNVNEVAPEAVLASQVVAGMNYCFLNHWFSESSGTCYWDLEFVYADLQGNGTMSNCYKIDIGEIYETI